MSYLYLVEEVWFKIDKTAASKVFWNQFMAVVKTIRLPPNYFQRKVKFFTTAGGHNVDDYELGYNRSYFHNLRAFILNLSKDLISLEERNDLAVDYFGQN